MILMYHHVAPVSAVPANPEPEEGWEWTHSPEALEHHITTLRRRGYSIESLNDVVSRIRQTGREPRKTAVLTFDDGWIDNHRYALPVLNRLGAKATFFATSEHLHEGRDDPRKVGPSELREMVRDGMEIGSHTRRHVDLTLTKGADLVEEVTGSKRDLEAVIQAPVESFAYPGGAFDTEATDAVRAAGFSAACVSLGPAPNDSTSLFWLFRDVLSESLDTPRDRVCLSPLARRLLAFRVKRRLRSHLAQGGS